MQHANQLINETSTYLLQHAHNPVDWLPYGEDAFMEAQRKNKPLLISIGYSSCHWCHVMERESFRDADIAKLMIDYFVCVKVNREEHPDVDQVYMDTVKQLHGSEGWPLNCFTLPDGSPFWGGTYFWPEQWKQLLTNIHELFYNRYDDVELQANKVTKGIVMQNSLIKKDSDGSTGTYNFDEIFNDLYKVFDLEEGGLNGSPKFPMPVVLRFLVQYYSRQKNTEALNIFDLTLQKMALGGIYDQVGGGFARYSTDSEWKVPHFEMMLYDNAQLISLYSAAFRVTGNRLYKEVVEQTIEFINRELKAPEGIFYSSLDAYSEGEEGLYYTWTSNEFNEVLGHYAVLGGEYYGVDAKGLWENGQNVLQRANDDELFAQQHYLSAEELDAFTNFCRIQLLKVRSQRIRPALDDKMIVAWNSLMIISLVDAYVALDCSAYLESAVHAGNFILEKLKRKDDGLFHTWKNDKSKIKAFLDDYAYTCEAFLKLYSVTTDEQWLHETDVLTAYVVNNFYDTHTGFFWDFELNDKQAFARKIEIDDGVLALGNSAIAKVLNKLGVLLHNSDYTEKVRRMLDTMENRISCNPVAYANWASLALLVEKEQSVIVVVGPEAVLVIRKLKERNLSGMHIMGSLTSSNLPYFENCFVEGKTLIYMCSGTYCMAPVETVEEAIRLIANTNSG